MRPHLQISSRQAALAALAALLLAAALLAACASSGGASDPRTAAPPQIERAAGVDLYPLPGPLVRGCNRLGREAAEPLLCPTLLPRPSRGISHAALIPDAYHLYPIRDGSGLAGVSITYSAESHSPRLNDPRRFVHFDVQTRSESDRLPPRVKRATLGGLEGLYSPATSRTFASEPYFANHARFFWQAGETRYAASVHDFGPRTRALLEALLRSLRPADSLPASPPREARGVQEFGLPLGPTSIAPAPDGVWVAGLGEAGARLVALGADGEKGRAIKVNRYLSPLAVAADGEDVWIAQTGFHQPDLLRLRADRRRFTRHFTAGGDLVDLALGKGHVWALDLGDVATHGALEKLSVRRDRVVARIPVGRVPAALAVGEGGIWVANSAERTVDRVRPGSGKARRSTRVGRTPVDVALGAGSAWAANAGGDSVSRIDPRTGKVTATIGVGKAPRALAFGFGSVWVANYLHDTVSRIDPASNAVTETIPVGAGPMSVAVSQGAVWVGNRLERAVSRIEP